jgi:transcriptional antiterminator RfaH
MPLLPPEPFVYPESLFAVVAPCDDARWWVLQTRARAEKALARSLWQREIAFFLPVYQRTWQKRDRKLVSQLPLFPGYLFLFGSEQARLRALKSREATGCLPVENQKELQEDLARLHRLLVGGASLLPGLNRHPREVLALRRGPWSGTEGSVLRRNGQLYLSVGVHWLRRRALVEIQEWMLEPKAEIRLGCPPLGSAHSTESMAEEVT